MKPFFETKNLIENIFQFNYYFLSHQTSKNTKNILYRNKQNPSNVLYTSRGLDFVSHIIY
jgi:hypothetical protein